MHQSAQRDLFYRFILNNVIRPQTAKIGWFGRFGPRAVSKSFIAYQSTTWPIVNAYLYKFWNETVEKYFELTVTGLSVSPYVLMVDA